MKITDQYLMEIFKETAEAQIKNSYTQYKEYYKSISMDIEDVQQEIKMEIFMCLSSEKISKLPEDELLKYIGETVHNTLLDLVGSATKNPIKSDVFLFTDNPKLSPLEIINNLDLDFIDQNILIKKFIGKKTAEEIAKELNITPASVGNRYRKIFKKYSKVQNKKTTEVRMSKSPNLNKEDNEDEELNYLTDVDKTTLSSLPEPQILFDQIKCHLTDLEYRIITKIFQEGYEVREVATEFGLAKSVIWYSYQSALKKLKKIVKK